MKTKAQHVKNKTKRKKSEKEKRKKIFALHLCTVKLELHYASYTCLCILRNKQPHFIFPMWGFAHPHRTHIDEWNCYRTSHITYLTICHFHFHFSLFLFRLSFLLLSLSLSLSLRSRFFCSARAFTFALLCFLWCQLLGSVFSLSLRFYSNFFVSLVSDFRHRISIRCAVGVFPIRRL